MAGISRLQLALSGEFSGSGVGLRDLIISSDLSKNFSGASVSFVAGELTITGTPASGNDAVNKAYADSIAAGFDPKASCRYGTVAPLHDAPAYDNGASGVGATLTGDGTGSINSPGLDGATDIALNDRLLIKDQAAALQNGIYTASDLGVDAVFATATLSGINAMSPGDQLLINGRTYTFNSPINGVTADEVLLGTGGTGNSNLLDTLTSFQHAINLTGTPGVDYGSNTTINADVTASPHDSGSPTATQLFTAKVAGTGPNAFLVSEFPAVSLNEIEWTAATLLGGVAGVAYVLTRATDQDGSPVNEVSGGNFTHVEVGATLQGSGWHVLFDGNVLIGTDGVVWSQTSSAGTFTAGDGIGIAGTVISVDINDLVGAGLENDGANNARIAAAAAGNGLKGGGGIALAVEPNDIAGAGLEDDGADALRIAAAAAGDGLTGGAGSALAVQAVAAGGIDVGASGISLTALGVDTAELADLGVTPQKLSYRNLIVDIAAASFVYGAPRSSYNAIATAGILDLDLFSHAILYRNGVNDMQQTIVATGSTDEWQLAGTTLFIHDDITASGNEYRLVYFGANA